MDFSLTEEQRAIRKTIREFAETEFPKYAKEADEKEQFPRELFDKLADLGFLAVGVPEEYGGVGLGMTDAAIIMEEMSRVDGGLAVAIWSSDFGSEAILRAGTDEQKEKWLPDLPTGDAIMGAAISEAAAGSDVAGVKTRADKDGDEYVINGSKMWITNGTIADYFVVLCVTDPEAENRHARFSTILVPADADGVTANKIYGKLGIRASDTAELQFDDVRVPVENRLGEEGDGFYHIMRFFNSTRIGVAAQAVGIAQGALEQATEYAKDREAFGRPIGDFQGIQFKLAEMATRTEAARNLTYKAAWYHDSDQANPISSSMAKWYAGETAVRVADEALQIHGGYGYVDEMDIERFYRDAKITEIYEGTKEIHKLIIARTLLGKLVG